MTTKTATHAMATIAFGRLEGDDHTIHVTTYAGEAAASGSSRAVAVSDDEWEAAYGTSEAEKIESVLGWGGLLTEHNREVCFVWFEV